VIQFPGPGNTTGGTARIQLFDTGKLDLTSRYSSNDLAIGSLEGDGQVLLGRHQLTVGTNNLNTSFSGAILDSRGALIKVGTGTLTLSGSNTYASGTTIRAGGLKVNNERGSGTGTGPVGVLAGTLGGSGIIAGPTTIGTGRGTGAYLQTGKGASNLSTLTIQSTLIFKSDGTYVCKLNTNKAKADQVLANGVTIEAGALFDLNTVGNTKLTANKVFTAISNTATTPISGSFANLADGSTLTVGVNKLQVSYSGGDGNDLTLTVVP
jgi:autotransporter-associated beta strand protein